MVWVIFGNSRVYSVDLQKLSTNIRQPFGDRQFWAMCIARTNQNDRTVVRLQRFEDLARDESEGAALT